MVMPIVIGVDEVGRGPLAGPVVACACVLPEGLAATAPWVAELKDSKKLSAKARERLAGLLQAHAPYALGVASVEEIDTMNILQASLLAMRRATEALLGQGHGQGGEQGAGVQVIVDGNQRIPGLLCPQQPVVKADATVPCVSAASILAKVYRDGLMAELAQAYPQYGWASNAGYGSAVHMAALKQYGPTPHHRRSFAPVMAELPPEKERPYAA